MTAKNTHMALAQTLGQTHFDAHKGNKIKKKKRDWHFLGIYYV